ncbi:MAG: hydrogenase iron-sulfur subunit [Spirochaetes bacterium]|nr:hydrogenase iron-sulfur subunit [Spirochaetota bacterium]
MNSTTKKQVKLYIFYCANSLDGDELNRAVHADEEIEYRIISLPCSGKANLLYLIKAFEKGADGLLMITCEKNKCHYLEGNLRSPKRVEEVNSLLEEIGMGKDRMAVLTVNGQGLEPVLSRLHEFSDSIKNMAALTA